jgi:succinoglycan biosynthesis transport protein ExoP
MKVEAPGTGRITRAVRWLPGIKAVAQPKSRVMKRGASAEAFRLLALNVQILLPPHAHRSVAIMSANPREGRSFVAANLAVALAEETPVVLVEQIGEDMPLRERLSARRNGNNVRLPSTLRDSTMETDFKDVFLHTPARTTDTGGLSRMVSEAAGAGFITVVDTPPALTSSSAFLLAREVGHVIYVVKCTPQDLGVHPQIRGQLERLDVKIIGLLVNEG